MGCSESLNKNSENDSAITGEAATKIYHACKYQNSSFCEESCCFVNEKCGNEDFGYKECDLETGEWLDRLYADTNCYAKCKGMQDLDFNITTAINYTVNQNTTYCTEGEKCINLSLLGYQRMDCSWSSIKSCERGCLNNSCIKLCKPGNFTCDRNNSRICDNDGNHWSFYIECRQGCENGLCIEINNTILNNTNNTSNITTQNNQTLNNLTQNNSTLNNTQNNSTNQSSQSCDSCISVLNLHYDAAGNDCQNLNDEYVIFENNCTHSCDLGNLVISDSSSHDYTFPTFILGSSNSFTLFTGNGTNTATELYWGSTYTPCKAIWNNDGDNLTIKNQNNQVILFYSYS